MDSNRDLIQDAAAVFAAIAEALDDAADPIMKETGLPVSQIRMLYTLHYEQDVNIGQLAQKLDIGLPTASYHVEKMVEAGLVERTERKTDRRAKIITLTPKGHAMINSFLQQPLNQMVRWLSQIKPDDLKMLMQGLKALAQITNSAAHPSSKAGTEQSDPLNNL